MHVNNILVSPTTSRKLQTAVSNFRALYSKAQLVEMLR